MITLYHGSNIKISKIDLSKSKKGKDFGKGFYLNRNKEQAYDMAVRTTKRLQCGNPVVTSFMFDEKLLSTCSDLRIKIFEDYTEEWAEFILSNRRNSNESQIHNYDIVVGPIADDSVGVQINRYILGYIELPRLIEELRYHGNHAIQYFFATEEAIKHLKLYDNE